MEQKEDKDFAPTWGNFLVFSVLAVAAFYYKIFWYLGGVMFLIFALITIPNNQIRNWFKSTLSSLLYLGLALLAIGIVVWLGSKGLGAVGSLGKYNGQTAEEWYYDYANAEDRYQKFRECVEEYDSFDIRTQISYGGVFYYCE